MSAVCSVSVVAEVLHDAVDDDDSDQVGHDHHLLGPVRHGMEVGPNALMSSTLTSRSRGVEVNLALELVESLTNVSVSSQFFPLNLYWAKSRT